MPRLLGGLQQVRAAAGDTLAARDAQQQRRRSLTAAAAVQNAVPARSLEPCDADPDTPAAASSSPESSGVSPMRAPARILRRIQSGRLAGFSGRGAGSDSAPVWRQAARASSESSSSAAGSRKAAGGPLGSWDNDTVVGAAQGREGMASDWDVVTASLDDSGSGNDVAAGLGAAPQLLSLGRGRKRRPLLRLPGLPGPAWVPDQAPSSERLTPLWPLSLHPMSYRQKNTERKQVDSAEKTGDRELADELRAVAADSADRSSASLASMDDGEASGSMDGVEHGGLQPVLDMEALRGADGCQDAQPSPSATERAAAQQSGCEASSSGEAVERAGGDVSPTARAPPARPDQASLVPAAANNAMPAARRRAAQPYARLLAMRQSAAARGAGRAGRVQVWRAGVMQHHPSCVQCAIFTKEIAQGCLQSDRISLTPSCLMW